MTRSVFARVIALGAAAFSVAGQAQDAPARGIYAVARAGASVNSEQKFDVDTLPSQFDDKTKYKTGLTGEIGGGYDFGMFRIEQTIGYNGNSLNLKDLGTSNLPASGRTRSYNVSVSGYVDIPLHAVFVPYIGGGIGASRVDANLSRVGASGVGSSYSGKDWGMTWHGDAGIGINVAAKTTLEIGGRYAQTSKLAFDGQDAGVATRYEPTLRTLSGTIGVRHIF
ncbi:outer membrane protein with beta-barrel domain [Sphingomonas sp. PP-CE-3G-477]|uniref:outer membrane protein n=1 Tax=unclassified Sphingomonas TaxID=196159 RepID=UPI000D347741|nr:MULTISPECIES: outer membrane beta-barrel protein [unclassified Sphingomonas]MBE2992524.1 outer membrane beta-barrel protein [Sphingomonas sp. CFBP 13603]PTQ66193.1 outer membrane protein with beta-barrel domain [Sphingomonas sp. PP-CE-3G-477]